jgi:hypothetical protein
MSNEQAFRFHEGEHWNIAVTYQDGDGNPIDLSGAQALEWAVSASKLSAAIHTASLANGEITIIDAVAGRADISVPPASQAGLAAGNYWQESRITNSGGVVSVQFHGPLTVSPSLLD